MDEQLKRRLIGAAVVISLGVIFLPMILDGGRHTEFEKVRIEIPQRPEVDYSSAIAPMTPPETRPARADSQTMQSDEIVQEGKKPILDAELEEIIKPIEEPQEVVSKDGVDLRQKESEPAEKPLKPVAKAESKPEDIKPDKPAATSPASKVASVPPPSASTVSAWVVQVGSFSNRNSAIELRDKLRKQGFAAFVESFDAAGKPSHRVRVGPETARSRSEKTLVELNKKMKLDGIVVTYP
jgi:DedD protein